MREIKFRAWDKIKRTMKYPIPYDNGIGVCPEELKGKFCPAELQDKNGHRSHISDVLMNDIYIPMLFTGLYDKNGKEIYENDIVKFYYGEEYKNVIGIIEYHDAGFCIDFNNCIIDGQCCEELNCFCDLKGNINEEYELEVIGNIHENSELLK